MTIVKFSVNSRKFTAHRQNDNFTYLKNEKKILDDRKSQIYHHFDEKRTGNSHFRNSRKMKFTSHRKIDVVHLFEILTNAKIVF